MLKMLNLSPRIVKLSLYLGILFPGYSLGQLHPQALDLQPEKTFKLANVSLACAQNLTPHLKLIPDMAADCSCSAGTNGQENLISLYWKALHHDPVYLAAYSSYLASLDSIKIARAPLLPQLSFLATADLSQKSPNLEFLPGEQIKNVVYFELDLSQVVFDYAKWMTWIKSQKQAQAAESAFKVVRSNLIIRLARAYLNILLDQDNLAFDEREEEAIRQQMLGIQQKFTVGLVALTDLLEVRARYDAAKARTIASKNALANAHEALEIIVGEPVKNIAGFKDQIPLDKPNPANPQLWAENAVKTSNNLRAVTYAAEAAGLEIKVQKAGHLPRLSLDASYTGDLYTQSPPPPEDPGPTVFNKFSMQWQIMLNLNIPIFTGGFVTASTRQAKFNYFAARDEVELVHRKLIADTYTYYDDLITALNRIPANAQAIVSAESSLKANEAGFNVGIRISSNVTDRLADLYSAKRDYAKSRYEYLLAMLSLEKQGGSLDAQFLCKINNNFLA